MDKNEIRKDFVFKDICATQHPITTKWELYGKNQYNPCVKVSNWWYHREGYPKDRDDYYHAAYNRLGTMEDENRWTTETQEAMETGRGNAELIALKNEHRPYRLLNFLSYPISLQTRKDLTPEEIRKLLPSLPKDMLTLRYTTTNQSDYRKVHILTK